MIRFFLRLGAAYAAERFCYWIATPEMRLAWAEYRLMVRLRASFEAAAGTMQGITRSLEKVAEDCAEILERTR